MVSDCLEEIVFEGENRCSIIVNCGEHSGKKLKLQSYSKVLDFINFDSEGLNCQQI